MIKKQCMNCGRYDGFSDGLLNEKLEQICEHCADFSGSTKPGPSWFFCDQNPCTHIDQNGDVMHLKLPTSSGLGNLEK